MTRTTTITCDECEKTIDARDGKFVFSYESSIYALSCVMHFCGHECIKKYLLNKWKEMHEPIVDSE